MVTIGMNYAVLPGKEETFENAFKKVVHAMGVRNHGMDFAEVHARLCDEAWGIDAGYAHLAGRGAWRRVDAAIEAVLEQREWGL